MKKAALVTSALLLGFLTMGVAFASSGLAPHTNAISTFTGSETSSTPKACGTSWITTLATLRGTSNDTSSLFSSSTPGDFTLASTANGLVIKALTTVSTANGLGTATGSFLLKESATRRLLGTFTAVEQVWDQNTGSAEGRGLVTANAQKKVTVNGKTTWRNTGRRLVANVEFGTGTFSTGGSAGDVSGSIGTDWSGPAVPTKAPSVPNLAVKTRNCS